MHVWPLTASVGRAACVCVCVCVCACVCVCVRVRLRVVCVRAPEACAVAGRLCTTVDRGPTVCAGAFGSKPRRRPRLAVAFDARVAPRRSCAPHLPPACHGVRPGKVSRKIAILIRASSTTKWQEHSLRNLSSQGRHEHTYILSRSNGGRRASRAVPVRVSGGTATRGRRWATHSLATSPCGMRYDTGKRTAHTRKYDNCRA